jgi:hypothetical protein
MFQLKVVPVLLQAGRVYLLAYLSRQVLVGYPPVVDLLSANGRHVE